MRVRAKLTPRAGLLWVLAFFVAGALAYWDLSQSTADHELGETNDPAPAATDVEVEVIYEEP